MCVIYYILNNPQDDALTPHRFKRGPSDRMTSSVRSDCSASQTNPIVTISGQFMSTRRILILWPQSLCKLCRKTQQILHFNNARSFFQIPHIKTHFKSEKCKVQFLNKKLMSKFIPLICGSIFVTKPDKTEIKIM